MIIESKENKKFKLLKRLLTKKGRKKEEMFIAEGKRFLEFPAVERYSLDKSLEESIGLSKELFSSLSTLDNSDGVISLFKSNLKDIDSLKGDSIALYGVQDPGNLGTIMRTALSMGIKNMILLDGSCDPYNSKVIRASAGAILSLNICFSNLDKVKEKYTVYAADMKGDSIEETKFKGSEIALLFGGENKGTPEGLENYVSIPIDEIESINVGVAAGIFLYEFKKKRS